MTEDRQGVKKHNFRNFNIFGQRSRSPLLSMQLAGHSPWDEICGLIRQLRRAAVSISLNIAGGSGCGSAQEFRHFLMIALRSDYEVMTCLEIAVQLGYCRKEDANRLTEEADEIAAMITGFSKSL